MADLGCFRQTRLTVWVRVPNPHRRADDQFFSTFKREIETRGLAGLPSALASSWRAASGEQVARRLLDEETAAFEEAEKTFRLIERECQVKLTPFTRDELWAAVFLGHRQNATSVPILPDDGTDLRDYLCGETIEANGQYLLHGNSPAALVSMFTPPQPFATSDALKRMDNQFERLEHDHQIAADNAAQLQTYLESKREEVERLKNCEDCTEKDRDLERLSFEVAQLEEKAARSQSEAARLLDLKAKRAEAIYQVETQRIHFGRTIRSMNRAWKGITTATQELRDNLEKGSNDN